MIQEKKYIFIFITISFVVYFAAQRIKQNSFQGIINE